jgi:sirohydrochlorin ferrochelatase
MADDDSNEVFGELLGVVPRELGVIIVDHGSRRSESNDLLLEVAAAFQHTTGLRIVEPAHMELAEPSIATAYARCVEAGAKTVVVHPYFLSPGRHWRHDIPELAAAAATNHPETRFLVTSPLGLHPLMLRIMQDRISHCLAHAQGKANACDVCRDEVGCSFSSAAGTALPPVSP